MGQLNAGIVPVTPFQQNCTILFDMDDKHGVVVDPGGDIDKVLAALKDNARSSVRMKPTSRCSTIWKIRAGAMASPVRATACPTGS
jgi:hypothetical protein